MEPVGIVTFYRVRNIGACLQAYAMKTVLEQAGAKPYFIKCPNLRFAFELYKGDTGDIRPWNIPFLIEKNLRFRRFFRVFDHIDEAEISECGIRTVILGSDSIWCAKYGARDVPDLYFGQVNAERIYAYAPSIGGGFVQEAYPPSKLELLKKIDAVTVRDYQTKRLVELAGRVSPQIVVDPTLLADWRKIAEEHKPAASRKYALTYGPFSLSQLAEIKRFAHEENLILVNIGGFNRRILHNIPTDPFAFLGWLTGAEVVFTSMFHGVMLSLSLNKEFKYVPHMKDRTEKLRALFDIINIRDEMVFDNCLDDESRFSWRGQIPYEEINARLRLEREKSMRMIADWIKR